MFKKILCATDGSESARQAARIAWDLTQKYGSRLTILNVAPLRLLDLMASPRGPMIAEDILPRQVEERLAEHAREVLADTLAVIPEDQRAGIEVRDLLGHPGDAICQAVDDEKFDLVVVGSRGQSSLRRAIMGSVSDYVAHHCDCPVLVVKAEA